MALIIGALSTFIDTPCLQLQGDVNHRFTLRASIVSDETCSLLRLCMKQDPLIYQMDLDTLFALANVPITGTVDKAFFSQWFKRHLSMDCPSVHPQVGSLKVLHAWVHDIPSRTREYHVVCYIASFWKRQKMPSIPFVLSPFFPNERAPLVKLFQLGHVYYTDIYLNVVEDNVKRGLFLLLCRGIGYLNTTSNRLSPTNVITPLDEQYPTWPLAVDCDTLFELMREYVLWHQERFYCVASMTRTRKDKRAKFLRDGSHQPKAHVGVYDEFATWVTGHYNITLFAAIGGGTRDRSITKIIAFAGNVLMRILCRFTDNERAPITIVTTPKG